MTFPFERVATTGKQAFATWRELKTVNQGEATLSNLAAHIRRYLVELLVGLTLLTLIR